MKPTVSVGPVLTEAFLLLSQVLQGRETGRGEVVRGPRRLWSAPGRLSWTLVLGLGSSAWQRWLLDRLSLSVRIPKLIPKLGLGTGILGLP